jgi:hypothetical protein
MGRCLFRIMKFKVLPVRLKGSTAAQRRERETDTMRCSLLGRNFAVASVKRSGDEV